MNSISCACVAGVTPLTALISVFGTCIVYAAAMLSSPLSKTGTFLPPLPSGYERTWLDFSALVESAQQWVMITIAMIEHHEVCRDCLFANVSEAQEDADDV